MHTLWGDQVDVQFRRMGMFYSECTLKTQKAPSLVATLQKKAEKLLPQNQTLEDTYDEHVRVHLLFLRYVLFYVSFFVYVPFIRNEIYFHFLELEDHM